MTPQNDLKIVVRVQYQRGDEWVTIDDPYETYLVIEGDLIAQRDELLEACKAMVESEDIDAERPSWVRSSIYSRVYCGFCGNLGNDIDSIEHAEDICPLVKAQAAIAKAEGQDYETD